MLEAQEWVNETYNGEPGFVEAPETGVTGWSTMHSLTRALQIELSVSPPSNAYGPGTLAAVQGISPIQTGSGAPGNVVKILQCAMWCKGYNPGNIDGDFGPMLTGAVEQVQFDLGVASRPDYGSVNGKLFKTLLTMDPYVQVGIGTAEIRDIQQWFNQTYIDRLNFFYLPTDGRFSRSIQTGLIYALQYELGLDDATANGTFGPTTRNLLGARAPLTIGTVDSETNFVHLFQAGLTFNGYPVVFDGDFGPASSATTGTFQAFAELDPTGTGTYDTWASLLVSTGNPDRPFQGIDTITSMIHAADGKPVARIAMGLKDKYTNLKQVGRYLTNAMIANPLDKKLRQDELALTIQAGLNVFPIYQTSGSAAVYFTPEQGRLDAENASRAAYRYGFQPAERIYFAVDFDATDDQIDAAILPYFAALAERMGEVAHAYPIGVYGTRNVCQQVINSGSAHRAFVAGMSTGWSGNLGYPLPTQWAYDQIREESASIDLPLIGDLPEETMSVGIDRLIVSPRGVGTNHHRAFERNLLWLNDYLINTLPPVTNQPNLVVCHPFRVYGNYVGYEWSLLSGDVDAAFVSQLPAIADQEGWPFAYFLDDPHGNVATNASHLMATMNVYVYDGVVPQNTPSVSMGEVGGWIGDLATFMADWLKAGAPTAARAWAQTNLGASHTSFSEEDLHADVDAANAARHRLDNNTSTAEAVVWALDHARGGTSKRRFETFVTQRWGASQTTAWESATAAVISTSHSNSAVRAAVDALVLTHADSIGVPMPDLILLSNTKRAELAEGFVDAVWQRAGMV